MKYCMEGQTGVERVRVAFLPCEVQVRELRGASEEDKQEPDAGLEIQAEARGLGAPDISDQRLGRGFLEVSEHLLMGCGNIMNVAS